MKLINRIRNGIATAILRRLMPYKVLIYQQEDSKPIVLTRDDLMTYMELLLSYRAIQSVYGEEDSQRQS